MFFFLLWFANCIIDIFTTISRNFFFFINWVVVLTDLVFPIIFYILGVDVDFNKAVVLGRKD